MVIALKISMSEYKDTIFTVPRVDLQVERKLAANGEFPSRSQAEEDERLRRIRNGICIHQRLVRPGVTIFPCNSGADSQSVYCFVHGRHVF